MLSKQQKALVHIYADAAELTRADYRARLASVTGYDTCAAPGFGQAHFERLMASLEATLFDRVALGLVPDPRLGSRHIRAERHWREREPRAGRINTRQAHLIDELWSTLKPCLPPDQRDLAYLARVLHKATGKRDIGYTALTSTEAAHLIDALRDRLAYAIRATAVAAPPVSAPPVAALAERGPTSNPEPGTRNPELTHANPARTHDDVVPF